MSLELDTTTRKNWVLFLRRASKRAAGVRKLRRAWSRVPLLREGEETPMQATGRAAGALRPGELASGNPSSVQLGAPPCLATSLVTRWVWPSHHCCPWEAGRCFAPPPSHHCCQDAQFPSPTLSPLSSKFLCRACVSPSFTFPLKAQSSPSPTACPGRALLISSNA